MNPLHEGYCSLLFLPVTPLFRCHFCALQQKILAPIKGKTLPLELQRDKDTVMCVSVVMEVTGHHQKLLAGTLIVLV